MCADQGNNDLARFSGWAQTDPRYQSLLSVSRNATLHAGKFWGHGTGVTSVNVSSNNRTVARTFAAR